MGRFPRLLGVVAWLAAPTSVLAFGAWSCTSFEDIVTARDGGEVTGDDTGDDLADDFPGDDDAGTRFCDLSEADLCLDLDDGQLEDDRLRKLVRGSGQAQISNEQSFSPAYSFFSSLPTQASDAGAAIAQLVYPADRVGDGVVCEFEIFVAQTSDGEMVPFSIQSVADHSVGLGFVKSGQAVEAFAQRVPIVVDGGTTTAKATASLGPVPFAEWIHVRVEHPFKADTKVFFGDKQQVVPPNVGPIPAEVDPQVSIGASAAGAAGWRLFFDNITCSAIGGD